MSLTSNILSLIPQQQPFVMIDVLHYCDEEITRTGFTVTEENVLTFNGKFTEAGLLENIAQTAAARAGWIAQNKNEPVRVGYIASVKDLEIFTLPVIGDQLITEIKTEETIASVSVISGSVFCNKVLIARCGMRVFIS